MRLAYIPVATAVLFAMTGPVRAAEPVTKVVLRNPADRPVENVPITFGQVFKKGDIKQGVVVGATGAVGQADVKRRYKDGSVRFAVISLVVPNLSGRGELAVDLSDGPVAAPVGASSPAGLLNTEFDATVRLNFSDGARRSVSARNLIRDTKSVTETWLSGPVCVERIVVGESIPGDKPMFYQDWKKLAEENIKFGNKPELPTCGGSYSYTARMAVACAVDAEFPGTKEALRVFERLLPDWHQQLTSDPTFAISPRGVTDD